MRKKLTIAALMLVIIGLTAFVILTGLLTPGVRNKPNTSEGSVNKTEKYIYPAYNRVQNEYKWGYIDNTGKFVIQPQFNKAEDFMENGLARIYVGEKVGLIDKNGNIVLKPEFYDITDFSEGLAVAHKDNTYQAVDEKGNVAFSSSYEINAFHDGIAVCSKEEGEGKRAYGYIDRQGKCIFEPQFTIAYDFNEGKGLAKIKDKEYVVIDKNGKILSLLHNNNIHGLSENIVVFNDDKNEKSGYMKVDGQIIIEPKFSSAGKFEKGYAVVNTVTDNYQDNAGLINLKGEFVVKPEYSDISPIGENLYYVGEKGQYSGGGLFGKKAVVSSEGRFLTGFDYYDVGELKNGYISVSDDKTTFLIDANGKKAEGMPVVNGRGRLALEGELIKAEIDEQLAYYSKDGKLVWQSENIFELKNGAKILETKFRPDVYMLIRYPQISNHPDKKVEENINNKLKDIFVGNRVSSKKEDGKYVEDINSNYGVVNIQNLLIITKNEYSYSFGAAHGMPLMETYHIDINTGRFYKLGDLFKKNSGYTERLNVILKQLMKKKSKENDSTFFYDMFEGINAGQGFVISDDKLQLFFQPYEIAPYSEGFPTFDIPYSEINDIIDKEGDFWKCFQKNIM
ncbi:MAG: WG repeat-containing protein [Deltaproteobacteria bacterium]